jgi:large subunit ribosomal protein L29
MDIDEVRALSDAELESGLADARQELWAARFALSTRQLKDYSSIPRIRRTIARIMTVQRERSAERTSGQEVAR